MTALWVAAILAASCVQAPVRKPVEVPVGPVRTVTGAAHYRVLGGGTLVYARVFRGGGLARLGHNHVVEFRNVRGDIFLARDITRSLFDITVTLADAVVDAPELRQRQGREFNTTISDGARTGTLRNMLGEEVLDAGKYPYVTISSSRIEGSPKSPAVTVNLTLKGVTRSMTIPVSMHIDDGRLVAKGRFTFLQSDFGIRPLSLLGGALKVEDRVELVFIIAAKRDHLDPEHAVRPRTVS